MTATTDRATAREPGSRAVTDTGEAARAPGPAGAGRAGSAVRTVRLSKRYGRDAVAVDALDLDVPHGAVYGFLGPNGSGKTTTIRMLLGLIEPTGGECELLGHPMPAAATRVLPHVGVMVDGPAFHPGLSGRDNLRRLDAADRTAPRADTRDRIAAALDRVGLLRVARKPFRAYSLGMKQRLALAAALLRPRRLLVLDEPTNGLDPQGTREVRALIAELAAGGLTVLLSTHLLGEVEQMCDHVGIMHRGRLKTQGPLGAIHSRVPTRVRVDTRDAAAAQWRLGELGLTDVRTETTGTEPAPAPPLTGAGPAPAADSGARPRPTHVTAVLGEHDPERILAGLVGDGIPVRDFRVLEPTLEEAFIALTGEGFDDHA